MSFTATEYSTIEDKELFLKQFKKFVNGGFKRSAFSRRLYERLSMCFGHTTHYNKDGFYNFFFSDEEGERAFIRQCLNYSCYGTPAFTYCDVETEIILWLAKWEIK